MAEKNGISADMYKFTVSSATRSAGPRTGRLVHRNRTPMKTPHYISVSSRGAIPHITQDIQAAHTSIMGTYMAYEDFVERAPKQLPPILDTPVSDSEDTSFGRLRNFTLQPSSTLLVLGLRRPSPITSLLSNTNEAVSICTSVGFRHENISNYISSAAHLQPDVVIGPADIVYGDVKSSVKRVQKMTDRTSAWTEQITSQIASNEENSIESTHPAIFAPILPIPFEQQRIYISDLINISTSTSSVLSGLAFHSASHASYIPDELSTLPKLSLEPPLSPHDVLKQVSSGIDILTIPFINVTTDAGIALDFQFPVPSNQKSTTDINGGTGHQPHELAPKPLGTDLWPTSLATSLTPLALNCTCYTCTSHHSAYINHLLSAKEMLGWTLLAIHNHHIIDGFFAGIREVLEESANGANDMWEQEVKRFEQYYEQDLPLSMMGRGPRVRGYQFKSGPSESKKNKVAYKDLAPKLEEDVKEMVM